MKCLLLTLLCALTTSAHAQQPCGAFDSSLEFSLQQIALETADSIGDSNAPRAALRAQRISNQLALMQMNLQLMSANKCAMPGVPINTSAYMSAALTCATARVRGESSPSACDFKNWKRDY